MILLTKNCKARLCLVTGEMRHMMDCMRYQTWDQITTHVKQDKLDIHMETFFVVMQGKYHGNGIW